MKRCPSAIVFGNKAVNDEILLLFNDNKFKVKTKTKKLTQVKTIWL